MKDVFDIRFIVLLGLLLTGVLLKGCLSTGGAGDDAVANAVSADYGPPEVVGQIETAEIRESSGLAVSRCQPNILWTHNDGGEPLIFAMTPEGMHRGVWRVPNARNIDWEDIATRKDAAGKCFLYIGNIGNNDRDRAELEIYRVPEPTVGPGHEALTGKTAIETAPAETLRFTYADAAQNAESLIVHPASEEIYIVSKNEKGPAAVYKLKPAFEADVQKAEKIADLSVAAKAPGRFTGGAISPDGRRVMLCDVENGYEFVLAGGDLDSIWKQQPKTVDLGKRKQGEGISYTPDGTSLYASSERKDAPIIRITRR